MSEATVEINEPEAKVEATAPTRDDLKSKGWSAAELDSAEKRGMVAPKVEVEAKAEVKPAEPVAAIVEPVKAPVKGSLPDFTMNADQERVFLETFGAGTPPRAMYFRMKNERQSRQMAEAKSKELELRLKALETKPVEVDLGDEDAPLTLKSLQALQKAEAEALDRRAQEQQDRNRTVTAAQTEQEEYARSIYSDFDAAVGQAKDVMQNLEALVPEKHRQTRVVKLVRELQVAAANADKYGLDDDHAAMIAYEIGKFHPQYGTTLKGEETEKTPKANGGLTPEQMKRIEGNTQRRGSSAAIPAGGGKRTISVEDVDASALNKMSYAERAKFRTNHPERYNKLLRG